MAILTLFIIANKHKPTRESLSKSAPAGLCNMLKETAGEIVVMITTSVTTVTGLIRRSAVLLLPSVWEIPDLILHTTGKYTVSK